jgi:hypothetical protein
MCHQRLSLPRLPGLSNATVARVQPGSPLGGSDGAPTGYRCATLLGVMLLDNFVEAPAWGAQGRRTFPPFYKVGGGFGCVAAGAAMHAVGR